MYSHEDIQRLRLGRLTVDDMYFRLMMKCLSLLLSNSKAQEYVRHGFLRRLGILQECIHNVYNIYPADRCDLPSRKECLDLTINLQSFVFNAFGCVDNLAWIWVTEKQIKEKKGQGLRAVEVSFQSKTIKQTLPQDFREYLDSLIKWFDYLKEFRHALGHRIPLYIPPYTVTPENIGEHDELERKKAAAIHQRDYAEYHRLDAEQTKLGKFTPAMTHSHNESSGLVAFHAQLLADWNTVTEIAEKFFDLLSGSKP